MTLFAGLLAVVDPRYAGRWEKPVLASLLVPIVWSVHQDYLFFRGTLQATTRAAMADVALNRAVSWSAALTYFFGIALWPMIYAVLPRWVAP
jgi:hypothetical protein